MGKIQRQYWIKYALNYEAVQVKNKIERRIGELFDKLFRPIIFLEFFKNFLKLVVYHKYLRGKILKITKIGSERFFPWWREHEVDQVIGLLHMISEIIRIEPKIFTMVEIGSHIGEGTSIFLGFLSIEKIYCVDTWHMDTNFEEIFKMRLSRYFGHRCFPVKKSSEEFAHEFTDILDLVYIDGDHRYEFVKKDLTTWYEKLRVGGFLCGHDYSLHPFPEVKRAIDEFVSKYNLKITTFVDASWYIRKIGSY